MYEVLLLEREPHPVIEVNASAGSSVVLVCEHAGRLLPEALGDLGLPASELSRHIAWDIGAEPLSRRLSELMDAPLLLQRYSRLAYDCNRPPEHPGAMPEISELTPIPGNRNLTASQKAARAQSLYFPFHAAVQNVLDKKCARGETPVLVTIHSFTRRFKGVERAVELGLLHHADDRLAKAMAGVMGRRHPEIDTRINEPYGPGDGVAHTVDLHGNSRGIMNVMIEVRNDLIAEEKGQAIWAELLAGVINEALKGLRGAT